MKNKKKSKIQNEPETPWQIFRRKEYNLNWWEGFLAYFDYAKKMGEHIVADDIGINSKNFAQIAGTLSNPRIIDGYYFIDLTNCTGTVRLEVCSATFVHEFIRGFCYDITLKDKNGNKFTHFYLSSKEWHKKLTPEKLREREEKRAAAPFPPTIILPMIKNPCKYDLREVICSNPFSNFIN